MSKEDNLGEFEQLVLLAVLRLGKHAYGARNQLMAMWEGVQPEPEGTGL